MKKARLDRTICNTVWRLKFQEGVVRHLLRAQSEHAPILIAPAGFPVHAHSCKPFQFHVAWYTHCTFEGVLRDNWDPNATLRANLQTLASELTHWNKEVFGNLFRRNRKLWARIEGIQRKLAQDGP